MPWSDLQLACDTFDDLLRAERESSVDEHGAQCVLRDMCLNHQQRSELRVSVLFDHEPDIMVVEELPDVRGEWKSSDPNEVDGNAGVTEEADRLADGEVTAADRHDTDHGTVATLDEW